MTTMNHKQDIDINKAKQEVEKTIQEMTQVLSQQRQKIQEIDLGGSDSCQSIYKKNLELIDLAQTQVHHIVNEYFKDVSDNYVLLQSKYPSNEVKNLVLTQINQNIQLLNEYQSKINNQSFTTQDYEQFQQDDFNKQQDEISKETENLTQQAQNVQKTARITQEQLPQVKINNRVVEGLYLNLNEYASVSWPGTLQKTTYVKPNIDTRSFFTGQNMPLPVIDDEKNSYGFYSLADGKNYIQQFHFKNQNQAHYQPSTIVSPEGMIYLIGGLNPQGLIVASTHCVDPAQHHVTTLKPMNVKRVAGTACYAPPCELLNGQKGYIFVFGGRTDNMVKTKLCERYDISADKWDLIDKMPQGKARPACCYHNETRSIYLFFGTDSYHKNTCLVEKYNIVKNEWSNIQLSNYLPGFDITLGSAVQINKDQILIFGGMRDSEYFKEQMYFSRKVLTYNTTNDTFAVINWQLPIDFLPLCNVIVQNNNVYGIGTFLKSMDEQPSLYLDGGLVLQFNENGPKVVKYVHAFQR